MIVRPDGPIPAKVMIVGEAPGEEEERKGIPFVGVSGMELDRMLHEARLTRSQCFVTNICRIRPPNNDISLFLRKPTKAKNPKPTAEDIRKAKHSIDSKKFVPLRDQLVHPAVKEGFDLLLKEIEMVQPNIIITLGGTAMWALTGRTGILKWRGSMLYATGLRAGEEPNSLKVLPTIHPAAILREWSMRAPAVNDLKRAARFVDGRPYPKPQWNFLIRPSYDQAVSCLHRLLLRLDNGEQLRLSFDIETRRGHIACAGISYSRTDAICIPFMCMERKEGYWKLEDEQSLVFLLYLTLSHRNAQVIGQNILYDSQYTYRHWHFVPNVAQDTMISQHSLFSDMPKALAFIASMYCDYYVYWKDEGKNWDKNLGEDQLWNYNCQDCVYTDEAGLVQLEAVKALGLEKVYVEQQKLFWPVLRAMQLGVKIDQPERGRLTLEVLDEISRREAFLFDVLGHELNPRSPKQMQELFYGDFKLPIQMTRAKKGQPSRPTLDDDALQKLCRIQPLVKPLVNCISDIRTMGIFVSSFLKAPLDNDGRMRCAFNIGGSESGKSAPKTYRLSSSENAFGGGANLQTIPSDKSKSVGKSAARGAQAGLGDLYRLPNIRSIFIPDSGFTWFDLDLDRADLQVVAWEAEDEMLKTALQMGVDLHLMNAFILKGKDPPPLEELVEAHPRYRDHRGPLKLDREFAKVFCHATNYGGKPRTVAAHTGRTIHEVDRAQKLWFGARPGIERWHKRTEHQIRTRRFVENKFGYRWYIFDRVDSVLPEALAWTPQSTVSNVINKIWMNIYDNLSQVQVLLQVHDSLCGQFPTAQRTATLEQILFHAKIVVPYDEPLVIPCGIKTSEKSWGDVK